MVGRVVAVCEGTKCQTSRIEKTLRKNQGVYRPELEVQKREKGGKRNN